MYQLKLKNYCKINKRTVKFLILNRLSVFLKDEMQLKRKFIELLHS